MGTYDHKQVFADYETGKIDVEMAMGHTLQHINRLYEAQQSVAAEQQKTRQSLAALQAEMAQLAQWQNALARVQQVVARLVAHTGLSLPQSNKKRPPAAPTP